jgi:hypothetical protein
VLYSNVALVLLKLGRVNEVGGALFTHNLWQSKAYYSRVHLQGHYLIKPWAAHMAVNTALLRGNALHCTQPTAHSRATHASNGYCF